MSSQPTPDPKAAELKELLDRYKTGKYKNGSKMFRLKERLRKKQG